MNANCNMVLSCTCNRFRQVCGVLERRVPTNARVFDNCRFRSLVEMPSLVRAALLAAAVGSVNAIEAWDRVNQQSTFTWADGPYGTLSWDVNVYSSFKYGGRTANWNTLGAWTDTQWNTTAQLFFVDFMGTGCPYGASIADCNELSYCTPSMFANPAAGAGKIVATFIYALIACGHGRCEKACCWQDYETVINAAGLLVIALDDNMARMGCANTCRMFDDGTGITIPIAYAAGPNIPQGIFGAMFGMVDGTAHLTLRIFSSKHTALWDKPENWAFVYLLAIGYVLIFVFTLYVLITSSICNHIGRLCDYSKTSTKSNGWLHIALVFEGILSSAMSFISIFMLGTSPLYRATAPNSRAQLFQNVPAVLSLPPSLIMGYKWTQVTWGQPWPPEVRLIADVFLMAACIGLVGGILYIIVNFCTLIDKLSPSGVYPAKLYKEMNDAVTYSNLGIASYFVASGLYAVARLIGSYHGEGTYSDKTLEKGAKMLLKWLVTSACGMFGFSIINLYHGLYYDGDTQPNGFPSLNFPAPLTFTVVYSQLQWWFAFIASLAQVIAMASLLKSNAVKSSTSNSCSSSSSSSSTSASSASVASSSSSSSSSVAPE